ATVEVTEDDQPSADHVGRLQAGVQLELCIDALRLIHGTPEHLQREPRILVGRMIRIGRDLQRLDTEDVSERRAANGRQLLERSLNQVVVQEEDIGGLVVGTAFQIIQTEAAVELVRSSAAAETIRAFLTPDSVVTCVAGEDVVP